MNRRNASRQRSVATGKVRPLTLGTSSGKPGDFGRWNHQARADWPDLWNKSKAGRPGANLCIVVVDSFVSPRCAQVSYIS